MTIFPNDTSNFTATSTLSILNKELAAEIKSWQKLDICPACEMRSIKTFATVRNMPYSRCCNCGFRFANPVPSDRVLMSFYNSPFYTNYRQLEENQIVQGHYFSISIGLDTMRHLASWLGNDKSLKILDYGCGPGSFTALLRNEFKFLNVEGLELNKQSVIIAQRNYGLTIASSLEELKHQLYDCVVLLEVIEHIPKPDIFFKQIASLVKPGGCVLIATPAVDNLLGLFLPSYADAPYTAPCHLSLFTHKAISCMLSRFGFNIERIQIIQSWGVIEKVIASLVYELDFLSPRSEEDFSDLLYIPNALGRLLGLKPQRSLPSNLFFRALRRVDGLIMRIVKHIPSVPMNGHMYLLARKHL
jgi:2-polyprenyl-3-methyl-5-hydroxy-6-metoxy-1,4-benzoquinol methylase